MIRRCLERFAGLRCAGLRCAGLRFAGLLFTGLLVAGLLVAAPAHADPDLAAARALRDGWLRHQLPRHAPVDGQARPRLPSAYDLDRVIIDLEVPGDRLLPDTGSMDIDVILRDDLDVLPIFAFFFSPLEIRQDGQPVEFRHDRAAGELLIFLARGQAGPIRLEMEVAFADYCQEPTGCVERGEQQQHLATVGWYPLNAEVGPDDPFQVELILRIADGRVPGATGSSLGSERDDGRVRWHFATTQPTFLPAFAVGPNALREWPGGVVMGVPPRSVDGGRFISTVMGGALTVYAELFGPYPYQRLGVNPISDQAGVGLGPQANILLPEVFWQIPPDAIESQVVAEVVAHEVAHQYFFNLVNIVDSGEGWMSEGFAEYAATRFSEARTGTRDHARTNYWDYMFGVDRRQDAAINSEQVDRRAPDVRQRIIYSKASALLHQVRARMPDFDAHLRDWVELNTGEIVTTDDFIEFMGTRGGRLIGDFIARWAQRPGYPTLRVSVERPRDGSDEMSVFIFQVDDTDFDGTAPLVAHFGDRGTQAVDVGINRGIPETLDLGRAQWFAFDPDLTIFRRVQADPAADVNLSGVVDGMDLLDVLATEGRAVPDPDWVDVVDIDRDLTVGPNDRRQVLSQWGAGWE